MRSKKEWLIILIGVIAAIVMSIYWLTQKPKTPDYEIPENFFFTDTAQKTQTNCPPAEKALTFLVLGQSQAANSNTTRTPSDGNKSLVNFWEGKCYLLSDPVLGASGNGGSLWPLFAQKLYPGTWRPMVILNGAAHGSPSEIWLPNTRSDVKLMDRLMENVRRYTEMGGKIDYIVYYQGEADSMNKVSKGTYKKNLNIIFDYLQQALPGDQKILMFATSYCPPYNDVSADIINAQKETAHERADTILAFNSDRLDGRYRHDGCHLNALGADVVTDQLRNLMIREITLNP